MNQFDWYRVIGIKLTFIPASTAISDGSYRACYVFHDPNTIDPSTSVNIALGYDNSKIRNLQRRWKVYYKMHKTYSIGSDVSGARQDRSGFSTTDIVIATQSVNVFATDLPTTTINIGDLIITYYLLFKGQRSIT